MQARPTRYSSFKFIIFFNFIKFILFIVLWITRVAVL